MLPKRTPENHQIIMYKFADTDPTKFNFTKMTKM